MTNNTPSGAKRHRESTESESHQTAKMFFFFFFFFFFRRASSNLHHSFTMVFTQNSSIFHWAVHQPIAFSRFEVTWGDSNRPLKNYGFLNDAIFSSHVCMRTNHLATYTQGCWIRNTVGVQGVFEESQVWLWFLSQYCIGSLWEETCCSVIDGKLQLIHTSAAKRNWQEQQ